MRTLNEFEDLNSRWKNFVNKYSIEFIKNKMTVDDYVIGHGNTNKSFCYCVERDLEELGSARGASALKFGIYYGKTKSDSFKTYRFNNKFGNTLEESFNCIKNELADLISKTKELYTFEDVPSKFSGMFKYKIMYLYNPNIMIPINLVEHCKYFCEKLGLEDCLDYKTCQQKLLKYKNTNFPSLTNLDFMRYLYKTFPEVKYKKYISAIKNNIDDTKPTVVNKEIKKRVSAYEDTNEELFVPSINDKNINAEFEIKNLKQILPQNKYLSHNYIEKKNSGTVDSAIKKVYSGRKAEKYFMSYLTFNQFIQDKDFFDVANKKDYPYDIKFKNMGLEVKNIQNGSFYLTDNEIALLKSKKTHLILVDINNGIWLLKNNSKWLNTTINHIFEIRTHCSRVYNNIDLTEIKILITDDIKEDVINISQYNKMQLSKLL